MVLPYANSRSYALSPKHYIFLCVPSDTPHVPSSGTAPMFFQHRTSHSTLLHRTRYIKRFHTSVLQCQGLVRGSIKRSEGLDNFARGSRISRGVRAGSASLARPLEIWRGPRAAFGRIRMCIYLSRGFVFHFKNVTRRLFQDQ